ncbi:MAG: hydantoinase B/oxoprolinase family protein [Proteobacteria bacterium]|nr:hydantoinase B/oxoprolinase family protein [Pseudomonadota bacterium]
MISTSTDSASLRDRVQAQVIRYALELVAEDMANTLMRTARSTVIKEVQDLSCALFDKSGRVIVQSKHAPMLLAGSTLTMQEALKALGDRPLKKGDVIIANDPFRGGQHIMDVMMLAPVYRGDALVGYVGSMAHHSDLGGASPGGVAGGLTEIYAEGLCFPFVRLYIGGHENEDLFALIANNIRVPHKTLGDLRAQASACLTGMRRYLEAIDRFGLAAIAAATDLLIAETEARLRVGLDRLPDGIFDGEDVVDDDGITEDSIPIRVRIVKQGRKATVDLTGCGDQVAGNINCPLATTLAAVQYAFTIALDRNVTPNHGCFTIIDIQTRKGSIVDPVRPAATAARTNVSLKVQEATLMALARMMPGQMMAPSHAQISHVAFVGRDPATGKSFVYNDIFGGGAGARPAQDGRDAQDTHLARFKNTPTEMIEHEYPVRVHSYALVPDSGGAGQYRGALGVMRDVEILVDGAVFSRYGDRQKHPVQGAEGGGTGKPGYFILNPGKDDKRLKSKGVDRLKKGDIVRVVTPGGGGFGDPQRREIAALAADLKEGKITEAFARAQYGDALTAAALQYIARGAVAAE